MLNIISQHLLGNMACLSYSMYFLGWLWFRFPPFQRQMQSEYKCLFPSNGNVDVCQDGEGSAVLSTSCFSCLKQQQVLFDWNGHEDAISI